MKYYVPLLDLQLLKAYRGHHQFYVQDLETESKVKVGCLSEEKQNMFIFKLFSIIVRLQRKNWVGLTLTNLSRLTFRPQSRVEKIM